MRSLYWAEVRHEVCAGMRGPLFPIVSVSLSLYILLILASSGQMQGMGAAGIPRNASYLVFQLASGMSMWLFFIWAWVFGQAVLRDRGVHLHEMVLSAPVCLRRLMLARFAGACVVALLLGAIMPLSLFLTPVLAWMGLISPDLVGPAPILATLWSLVVFILPTMLGMGALFFLAALLRRTIAGPFAVATLMMLVWMIGLVVLRGGDISDFAATLFDPTAFSEAERQTTQWTPSQKLSAIMTLSPELLINRLLWAGVPVLLLMWQLRGLTRESLMQSPTRKPKTARRGRISDESWLAHPLPPMGTGSWPRAAWLEASWFWKTSCMNWGTLLALAGLVVIGLLGSITHVVQHGEGPLIPRAPLLMPFMAEFFLLFLMFSIAGFVGMLMQRDRVTGMAEMLDACVSPVGTRVAGRVLAAVALTLLFSLAPALSAWLVMLFSATTINWWDPLAYQLMVVTPAMLEVCTIALVAHSLIRHAGAAHGVTMMLCFIAVANMEVQVVNYPPGRFALPAEISLSGLGGWHPWLASLMTLDLLKLSVATLLVSLTWLAWPRGCDLNLPQRWTVAAGRLRQGPGAMALLCVCLIGATSVVLYQRMVEQGEYQSLGQSQARDAAWERQWWSKPGAFHLAGGEVAITLSPRSRSGSALWGLHRVRADQELLTGGLPHGVTIEAVTVDGLPVAIETGEDQFAVTLGECAATGCEVQMRLSLALNDWPGGDSPSWLTPRGVWLRAQSILPTLGLDPDRRLQAPRDRQQHGLPPELASKPVASLRSSSGVAPAGHWRWQVTIAEDGVQSDQEGELEGPLDFALLWQPKAPQVTEQGPLALWHGSDYGQTAQAMVEDLHLMQGCVTAVLGRAPEVTQVLQSPRNLGSVALHGDQLWVPDNLGWDAAQQGFSRQLRRARLAQALARAELGRLSDARAQPGASWLLDGVPIWVGLECVRRHEGKAPWLALMQWHSDRLTDALGSLEAPVIPVALSGSTDWVGHYSALAMTQVYALKGGAALARDLVAITTRLRSGDTTQEAVTSVMGQALADQLLGQPVVSDLLVDGLAEDTQVSTRRWQWRDGGWQPISEGRHVLVLDESGRGQAVPLALPLKADEGALLLDAAPYPEKTFSDNVWPRL